MSVCNMSVCNMSVCLDVWYSRRTRIAPQLLNSLRMKLRSSVISSSGSLMPPTPTYVGLSLMCELALLPVLIAGARGEGSTHNSPM